MSDFTDQVDDSRRKQIHYKTALESFKIELKDTETLKKDRISSLAKLLEDAGFPKDMIRAKIAEDLKGYINRQYVYKVLEESTSQSVAKRQDDDKKEIEQSSISEEERPKKLLVATNGEIVDEDSEKALDEIYNPVKLKQKMDEEVREEKEETLLGNNDNNNVPLSLIPPDIRELKAKFDEQEAIIKQLREDNKAESDKVRKFQQMAFANPTLTEYKKQNAQLMTTIIELRKEITALRTSRMCPNCQNMPQVD